MCAGITGGSQPQLLNFCKAFFFPRIGRRAAVTYRPHKPPPPASGLSSQRRHMAAFQARPPHTPIPGMGLCSPRCGCPTPLRPLMCIWKRRAQLVPNGDGEQGHSGEKGERRRKKVGSVWKPSRHVVWRSHSTRRKRRGDNRGLSPRFMFSQHNGDSSRGRHTRRWVSRSPLRSQDQSATLRPPSEGKAGELCASPRVHARTLKPEREAKG